MTAKAHARDLLAYIAASPTPFQAVANAALRLAAAGYGELHETDEWNIEKGGKYFVKRDNAAIIAFETSTEPLAEHGFRIVGAHTDAPTFKIKPNPDLPTPDGYVKLDTEAYGGAILSTWFDRPLGVAGRVVLRGRAGGLEERLVHVAKPLLIIPNLCIHFNRDVNSGYAFNKQIDCLPLFAMRAGKGEDGFLRAVAAEAGFAAEELVDHDLYLFEAADGVLMGAEEEFVSASRIDNLAMVHAGLQGLTRSSKSPCTKVLAAFDNEEVGSRTAPGADSDFLTATLRRVSAALGQGEEGYRRALAHSLAVSADAAHATHPNYADRHDPANRPILGGGMTIKYSANRKYATTATTAAVFARACELAHEPFQTYVNRSDIAGGSTIGPAMSSWSGVATVDVGAPILAMHSIRELAHVNDLHAAQKIFARFFTYGK